MAKILAITMPVAHGVATMMNDNMNAAYDVVVIGGGAAGLSAALPLARSRRSAPVLDAGQPGNAPATGVHGFLSRDGINPLELLEFGWAELRAYGGQVMDGRVNSAVRDEVGFAVTLDDSLASGPRAMHMRCCSGS